MTTTNTPTWSIRAAAVEDAGFLSEMLAEAAQWRPSGSKPDVLARPELARYVAGWGRPGDLGVVAVGPDGDLAAAAWLRRFTAAEPGYGFVAEDVPELAIAVHPAWRGNGLARPLLRAVEEAARAAGVHAISLSVARANPVIALYRSEGYQTVTYQAADDTMVKRLDGPQTDRSTSGGTVVQVRASSRARPDAARGSQEVASGVFDVERARRETPGAASVNHLNNAGSALPPASVLAAVTEHLRLEARTGGYEAADAARDAIEHTYDAVAELVGCTRDEVAVVENATRAWDMAFYSLRFGPGDRILTSKAEYASNVIAFLQVAQRAGAVLELIPDDEHGQVSVSALGEMLDERVRLVAINHVPTHSGLVNPAAEIGRVTREAGVPFLLDACQSIGQLPVRVDEIGCDLLSATGRKFLRGPRGTGFLYVRGELVEQLDPPFLDLHAATWTTAEHYQIRPDARRFENWETYVAGKIGLGVAIDYALGWGLDAISDRVATLADSLRTRLASIPGVTVHDRGAQRCAIVTFTKEGVPAAEISQRLRSEGINTSVTTLASARFDLESRPVSAMVRASVHYYNTDDELEQLCEAVEHLE
jgi:selenocysteine lyase/cysteine desulfurase/GNAT superfamily N-acetyltransferase